MLGLDLSQLAFKPDGLPRIFTIREFRRYYGIRLNLKKKEALALLLFLYENGVIVKRGFGRWSWATNQTASRTPLTLVAKAEPTGTHLLAQV